MERESNEHIKKIIDSIKSIIFRNKVEPTPENIIKYTSEAILNLKDEKSINDLTSVLFVYKDFMQDDEILNNVACKLIEDGFEDKGLRIFKVFIQNEHFYEAHLDLLLSLCRNKNNNKKIKSVLEQFLSKCRDCKLIEASFNKLSDYEFLYAYELFFSYLNEHFNAKVRLEGIFERTLKIIDTDKRNKMFNLFLSLILKYTCWLSNIEEVRDHVSDTKKGELIDLMKRNLLYEGKNNDSTLEKDYDTFLLFYKKEIDFINNYIRKTFDFTYSDNVILLKIIGKLLEIDRIFLLRYKVNIYRLNKEIKNHVKMIILGEEINIKEIDKFIESVKHVLIPEFIDLIRELGSLYNLGKQDKYVPVLRSIVCNISIEELINIVDIDYEKWIPVLKCSVNNDLKIFIELYGKIGGSKALILFPSFCNFCTDNENSILCLIDILKANLNNSLYYCTICAVSKIF